MTGKDDSTVEAPKAPSAICLSAPNGQTAWGFEAFAEDIAKTSVRRLFKPWLDEDFATLAEALRGPNDADAEISKEEEEEEEEDVGDEHGIQHENIRMDVSKAEECLRQYLLGLHDYIRKYMYEHLPTLKWLSAAIWFQFSYPATWDLTTQKRFKRIVESAGFSQGKKHRVSALSLNEAEAAMVSFFVEETRRSAGETILTADLGGCTTDMSTFEITGDDGKKVALQVSDSDARYNGSLKIDGAIRRELYPTIQQEIATMSAFRHLSAGEKKRHAQAEVRRILREERNYITAKHGFKPDTKTCKVLLGLKNQKGEPVSKLKVDLIKALRKALNEQCDAVWSQIEGQIEAQPKPDSLGCLVLTGGVSNNKYIQARLRKEANENYHQTEVMVPETPELAVSRGLVHETLESINRCSVFRYESSFFYGVVVSTENNMPTKLVSKGKVISTKDFKKKKSVTLPTMSHDTKIWLVRWSEKNGPRNNEEVGCLTEDLPALWTWKSDIWQGSDD
ncbi:hypothetical protein N0V92_006696 [Colletotrichum tropicale]|nr:hypothetical protein N0V92_006696 [Colletotrichum tropicale]